MNQTANHPSFGIKLDAYDLGEIIGQGTVGTIYRAVRKADQMAVAVKLLLPGMIDNELVYARFQREMMILEDLNHPNIIKYFGGGYHERQPFIVLELVEGGNLRELLSTQGPLTWTEVVTIGRQLASALQHAHNHGVIHRDIKPSNLLLTKEGQVKLTDFGIARNLHSTDLTESGMTVGSHLYMPPEQITGERNISGKSDLYSMGCLLYELLVGEPPFNGKHFAELFEQHLHTPPPSVIKQGVACPVELDELIQTLLAKQADDRPFNARQVQGALIHVAEKAASAMPNSFRKPNSTSVAPREDRKQDVGADEVFEQGLQSLAQRVQNPAEGRTLEISWPKLAIGLGAAGLLFFLIWMFS